ncbi:MAG: NUDIX domain-containing protein [Nitrospiraceae bacterium]
MRHIEVAAGLIVHEGRYLIAKRKAGVHLGGLWEFPGGKREAGESLEECLPPPPTGNCWKS